MGGGGGGGGVGGAPPSWLLGVACSTIDGALPFKLASAPVWVLVLLPPPPPRFTEAQANQLLDPLS